MKRFTGNCPRCDSEDCGIVNYENLFDAIAVHYECVDCGKDFDVIFNDGKVMEGKK
jgi:DNA-directed RNA polymerase subunit RPC12/RpoP